MTGITHRGQTGLARRFSLTVLAKEIAILVAALLLALPTVAQDSSISAWRLTDWGTWENLPKANPYAAIAVSGSQQSRGNAGSSIAIEARAVFEPDLSRAEISAEFVPVSRGIIPSDSRLFIAPIGQRLEWKVTVTVRNPNDVSMTDIHVCNQFGKAFRVALTGRSAGDARMADGDAKGLLPISSGFTWDIGYLGPGEAARSELTVATNQTGGRAEFVEEGVYSLDTGFQLTYRLLGKNEVRNTAPCSVIARVNPGALRPDAGPYTVAQKPIEQDWPFPEKPFPERLFPGRPGAGLPTVTQAPGQKGQAVIERVAPEPSPEELKHLETDGAAAKDIGRGEFWQRFTVTAKGVEGNLAENGGKFVVPAGEYAEWEVHLKVKNAFQFISWDGWAATMDFGDELQVEVIECDPGTAVTCVQNPVTGRTTVTWYGQSALPPRQGAGASLKVCTKAPDHLTTLGDRVFLEDIRLWYGFTIGWFTYDVWIVLDPICVIVEAVPEAAVSVSATRLDWRVRKPGTYAALAAEITATGYGILSIQFSEFADPAPTPGMSGTVELWYGFGDALADVDRLGWIAASSLNGQSRSIDLSNPVPVVMWSKISVGEEDPSAEYENKGVITFIVGNSPISTGEGNQKP